LPLSIYWVCILSLLLSALSKRCPPLDGLRLPEGSLLHSALLLTGGGHLKATNREASAKPLPMHPALNTALPEWKAQRLYKAETDFVFASLGRTAREQGGDIDWDAKNITSVARGFTSIWARARGRKAAGPWQWARWSLSTWRNGTGKRPMLR
jgi:hypothetical protein